MKRILVVDDEKNMCAVLKMLLEKDGYVVDTSFSGREAIDKIIRNDSIDLIISDLRMPDLDGLGILEFLKETTRDIPLVVITAYGSVESAVDAMKKGVKDFITKPFNKDVIRLVVERIFQVEKNREETVISEEKLRESNVIYRSDAMSKIMETARKVAAVTTPVLILGESGTGKGIVARAIHDFGCASLEIGYQKPFIEINCPVIPETLFESELFGYQKGAFTGATKNLFGKVSFAEGGTLFFDEIGELPFSIQAKLLKLIEEKTYEPLGCTTKVNLNTRVICTTNRNLKQLIQEGYFRDDLFYRISGIIINIPPLRARKDDILPLSHFFLNRYCREFGSKVVSISAAVREALLTYCWPGNIRELRNVIERAVVLCNEQEIRLIDLPGDFHELFYSKEKEVGNKLEDVERKLLIDVLNINHWNISAAARDLGITRSTLRYRVQKYQICHN